MREFTVTAAESVTVYLGFDRRLQGAAVICLVTFDVEDKPSLRPHGVISMEVHIVNNLPVVYAIAKPGTIWVKAGSLPWCILE